MTKSWACTKNSKLTRINCVYVQFKPILVHSVFIQFHVARCALARFNITNYTQRAMSQMQWSVLSIALENCARAQNDSENSCFISFGILFSCVYVSVFTNQRERANHAANSKTNRLQHLPICVFVSPLSSGISVWPAIHCCKKKRKKNKIIIIECRFINFTRI